MRPFVFFSSLLLACSSSTAGNTHVDPIPLDGHDYPSLPSCDPLTGGVQHIVFSSFLAAGKHADGTIYALDRATDLRAFESSGGGGLYQRVVAGSGEEGGANGSITVSVQKPNVFTLKVELTDGAPTRMGVVRGTIPGKTFEIGKDGDTLEIVPRTTCDALGINSLPIDNIVESAWTLADGHLLYLVRPEYEWNYSQFLVFYGVSTRMVQRPVLDVQRGSATYVRFKLDDKEVNAYFGSSLAADPNSYLTVDGTKLALTAATEAAVSYFCR